MLGGSLGAVAGRNSFGIATEWLARSWQDGFELLADCIVEPAFPASELAREKRLLLDDQVNQRDNPTQVAFRLFSETLYGDHPYHRDVLGTARSIGSMSRATLAAFYRDHYPVSALAIAIVGDVDLDDAVARATERFGGAKRVAVPAPKIAPPSFDGRPAAQREVYRYLERAPAHLVVGFPGATVDAPDRFALEVLIAVLGGQSGRLFAELRDKQGLVYRVSAHSIEGVDPGFVAIYLSCAPDKLDAATAAVVGELDRIRTSGVTGDELARAKSYLVGSHQIAMQRRSAVANAIAYHEAYGLGWQAWAGYDAAIGAVTPAEVAAARPRAVSAARSPRSPRRCGHHGELARGHEALQVAGPAARAGAVASSLVAIASTWRCMSEVRDTGHGELEASLVLVFPLLLAYEIGVLFAGRVNGADVVTCALYATIEQPHRLPAAPRRDRRAVPAVDPAGRALGLAAAARRAAGRARGRDLRVHARLRDHARARSRARPRHLRQLRRLRARRGGARGARLPARPARRVCRDVPVASGAAASRSPSRSRR